VYHGYGGKAQVPQELTGMTLLLAATNGKDIVVGADSFVYEGNGSAGTYRSYTAPKLRLINNGQWIVAFTRLGSAARNVWEYIEARGCTFNADIKIGVMECVECMGNALTKFGLEIDANVLLVGFSGPEPRIYNWNMAKPTVEGGSFPPWHALGEIVPGLVESRDSRHGAGYATCTC